MDHLLIVPTQSQPETIRDATRRAFTWGGDRERSMNAADKPSSLTTGAADNFGRSLAGSLPAGMGENRTLANLFAHLSLEGQFRCRHRSVVLVTNVHDKDPLRADVEYV